MKSKTKHLLFVGGIIGLVLGIVLFIGAIAQFDLGFITTTMIGWLIAGSLVLIFSNVKLKKTTRNVLLVLAIIAALFIVALNNNLLSFFQPESNGLTQFVIQDGQKERYALVYGNSHWGGGDFVTSQQSLGQNTNDVFSASTISKEVSIDTGKNTFRFVSEITGKGVNFGLPNDGKDVYGLAGCWQRISVYKNGQLVDTVKSWGSDSNPRATQNHWSGNIWKFYDDDPSSSHIDLTMDSSTYDEFTPDCLAWVNNYKLNFGEKTFNLNISTPIQTYVEGENISFDLSAYNSLSISVPTTLEVSFKVNTIFGDIISKQSKSVTLKPGNNDFTFYLPATQTETELKITSTATILYPIDSLAGVNDKQRPLSNYAVCGDPTGNGGCKFWNIYRNAGAPGRSEGDINVGEVISNEQIISISPRPLYLPYNNGMCLTGYIANQDKTYCIRDDVSQLSCVVIGCPNINGVNYECSSGGQCTQTVYLPLQCKYDQTSFSKLNSSDQANVDKNTICPKDTTCDLGTGFCVSSPLAQDLLQCNTASDCAIPCDGISASCNTGLCGYSGVCNSQQYGCVQVGCAEDYTCNTSKNVCEKPSLFSINFQLVLAIGFLIALLIIVFLIIRRRK